MDVRVGVGSGIKRGEVVAGLMLLDINAPEIFVEVTVDEVEMETEVPVPFPCLPFIYRHPYRHLVVFVPLNLPSDKNVFVMSVIVIGFKVKVPDRTCIQKEWTFRLYLADSEIVSMQGQVGHESLAVFEHITDPFIGPVSRILVSE
jgi:hypothetical protein